MKDWKIVEAFSQIDERFIEEAEKEMERKKIKKFPIRYFSSAVAACFCLLLLLPNLSKETAYALQSIPGIGSYFQLITFRKYSFEDGNHKAEVVVPKLAQGKDEKGTADKGQSGERESLSQGGEAGSLAAKESEKSNSAQEINFDIEKKTDELIAQFKQEMQDSEFKNLSVSSQVILDSKDYYVLALSALQQEGDSFTQNHYYTMNKHSGKLLQLSELFPENADYQKLLSDEVISQMKAHNQKGEYPYFIQDGEDDQGFMEVEKNQSFYINGEGKLVLVFPQGEVAPMAQGEQQFIMPESIWKA